MARIVLDDVAHSYGSAPARAAGLRAEAARPCLGGRRRLCAARALRLRQDHAAQHHLRADHAERGPRALRRHGRDRAADGGAQHRAGVPVPGDLRHHDGRAITSPSRCATAASRRPRSTKRVARGRRDARPRRSWRKRARGLTADAEAEGLARPRPGAPGRHRHPLRRAAHRHRPASEMAAALAS